MEKFTGAAAIIGTHLPGPRDMNSGVNAVSSKFLRMLDRHLERRNGQLARVLERHGLDPKLLEECEQLVPIETVSQVMEDAAIAVGEPCLGLKWSLDYPLSATGILGYLIMHSGSIGEALANCARYANLVMSPVEARFTVTMVDGQRTGEYSWHWPSWLPATATQYKSFMSALMLLRLRTDTTRRWEPMAVELQCAGTPCSEISRRIFGVRTTYNAPRNRILVDGSALSLGFVSADHRLLPIIKSQAEKLREELPRSGRLEQQIRAIIVEKLDKGDVTLDTVAQLLGTSPTAVRSALTRSGTSFGALLAETRQNLANHYLQNTDFSLTEIAFLLGYSELSAFTRATRRWFGTTPGKMRRQTGA